MSGAISNAMSEVLYDIPREILTLAYQRNEFGIVNPNTSITDAIRADVVFPRVLKDINLVGGIEMTVPVSDLRVEYPEVGVAIFNIPPARLFNRVILSCLSVSYGILTTQAGQSLDTLPYGTGSNNNAGPVVANHIVNSYGAVPVLAQASCDVVGPYSVRVRDMVRYQSIAHVRLHVSNDEQLANIPPRAWPIFSELVLLAVKADIYRKLRVKMEKVYLASGQELGVISDLVAEYSDSNTMYKDFLKNRWSKVAKMIDGPTYERFLRSQANIGL